MVSISTGDRGTNVARVSEADTAVRMGSGDLPLLATPRLIAWLEAAAVAALHGLPKELTSVGIGISVDHRAPSLVGSRVDTEAEVRVVDGRRIEFEVRALDAGQLVADGIHTRMIVDRQRFLTRAGLEP